MKERFFFANAHKKERNLISLKKNVFPLELIEINLGIPLSFGFNCLISKKNFAYRQNQVAMVWGVEPSIKKHHGLWIYLNPVDFFVMVFHLQSPLRPVATKLKSIQFNLILQSFKYDRNGEMVKWTHIRWTNWILRCIKLH